MGQILLSLEGFPEQVSNKKREIFAGYYNRLFAANTELLSQKTIDSILAYRKIEAVYSESQYDDTAQKNMYILYLSNCFKSKEYKKLITIFEIFLSTYAKSIPADKRPSIPKRSALRCQHMAHLDKRYNRRAYLEGLEHARL